MRRIRQSVVIAVLGAIALFVLDAPANAAITSYAIVQEDGSLRVRGKIIYLFGIYIPDTGRHCRFTFRPPTCGSRAAVALQQRIQGFVSCHRTARYRDGSLEAVCYANGSRRRGGIDLGVWLIRRGWALAAPYAPFEYHAAEKIARSRGKGLWGFSADSVR